MEAIRTIQTVENGGVYLQLPKQFWGQAVEIIVLSADRITQKITQAPDTPPNESFDPRHFFGVAHESRQAIDDYLSSLREGWH